MIDDDFSVAPKVHVVDDDPSFCRIIKSQLEHAGYVAKTYESARRFLAEVRPETSGCAVLDLQMPDMDGQALQLELAKAGILLPIIFLTGNADVPIATQVMRRGAIDLLEKPYKLPALLNAVAAGLEKDSVTRRERNRINLAKKRVANLTPREFEIAKLVVAGNPNKVIATTLGISRRTVEIHRAHIMSKLGAGCAADLVVQWTLALPGPDTGQPSWSPAPNIESDRSI